MFTFLALYWENVKKIASAGFKMNPISGMYPVGALWDIGHIILMPITLTIGALIGATVDSLDRNFVSKRKIAKITKKVDDIPEPELDQLKDKMFETNRNTKIVKRLLNVDRQVKDGENKLDHQFEKQHDKKKYQLASEQLGVDAKNYSENFISNLNLDSGNTIKLKEFDEKQKPIFENKKIEVHQKKCEIQKRDIHLYLNKSKNNGTDIMWRVINFFALRKQNNVNENPVYEDVKKNTI